MPNPMWPGGVHPRARAQVKEEVKDDEELPAGSQRGEKKIRVLDDPKHKVKVKEDKRAKEEAKAEELKAKLVRRKEQFAAGRQCGKEDAKLRSRIEEQLFRGDAYAPDPRSATASSSRVPAQGPKPPSGPPPKSSTAAATEGHSESYSRSSANSSKKLRRSFKQSRWRNACFRSNFRR